MLGVDGTETSVPITSLYSTEPACCAGSSGWTGILTSNAKSKDPQFLLQPSQVASLLDLSSPQTQVWQPLPSPPRVLPQLDRALHRCSLTWAEPPCCSCTRCTPPGYRSPSGPEALSCYPAGKQNRTQNTQNNSLADTTQDFSSTSYTQARSPPPISPSSTHLCTQSGLGSEISVPKPQTGLSLWKMELRQSSIPHYDVLVMFAPWDSSLASPKPHPTTSSKACNPTAQACKKWDRLGLQCYLFHWLTLKSSQQRT